MVFMTRPLIGITCDYDMEKQTTKLHRGYYDAIVEAGGLPVLMPNIHEENACKILAFLDGLLLSGGNDVEPAYFGEAPHIKLGFINACRDSLEINLCRQAMERDIPILGICRGVQLMNIAMGGTIYQDLESQWIAGQLQKHSQLAPDWYGSHEVELDLNSRLFRMLGVKKLRTNSFHHQAIRDLASCFRATAWCGDGVVEGIEALSHTFAVGVQWHPEKMWQKDEKMLGLFEGLVSAAKRRREKEGV